MDPEGIEETTPGWRVKWNDLRPLKLTPADLALLKIDSELADAVAREMGIPAHLLRDGEWGPSGALVAMRHAQAFDYFVEKQREMLAKFAFETIEWRLRYPAKFRPNYDTKRLILRGPTNFTPKTKRHFWER